MSDELHITANPLPTYERKNIKADIDYVVNLVLQNGAFKVVFGLPLNMNGSESEMSLQTREFATRLLKTYEQLKSEQLGEQSGGQQNSLEIDFIDERLSSVQANKVLDKANVKGTKNKNKYVDAVVATLLLQTYLNYKV